MISKDSPIGFFDSGVGGTSIWKEMIALLPNENTIYLADSANAPYGKKSKKEIIALSEKNTEFLINKGCKLIVVACNTATTNAITHLRNKYAIPFIGIEPAIKPAALQTRTNTIGILATKGTLCSDLFAKTSTKFASHVQVIEQVGEGLVELIEKGETDSKKVKKLLNVYLLPMKEKQIDYLILGCTHYPYIIPSIRTIVGGEVHIIDSGYAVSKQIKKVLTKNKLLNTSTKKPFHHFFTNTTTKVIRKLLIDINENKELFFNKI